jgi:hypothetical protein
MTTYAFEFRELQIPTSRPAMKARVVVVPMAARPQHCVRWARKRLLKLIHDHHVPTLFPPTKHASEPRVLDSHHKKHTLMRPVKYI